MKLPHSFFSSSRITATLLVLGLQGLLAVGEGRLAVVTDGNYRDTDDVCGTPVSMAILHSLGLADKLVHYSHSCDITPKGKDAGQGQEAEREETMRISCQGTADRWGDFPNVVDYLNCKREYDAVVEDLRKAIDASSADDLLYIIEAGEPDVIYDAMEAAEEEKRGHVRIVTHHPHNDRGDTHDLTDIVAMEGFSKNKVLRIPDQNKELKKDLATWHWARDHDDFRITWLWDRGEIAQVPHWGYKGILGSFDCSDAGMIWYWATGEEHCTMAQLKDTFTTFVNENPIAAAAEAEDAEVAHGEVKSSYDVSGQKYVAGSENLKLSWNFAATTADYELAFFVHSPADTRQLGVFVNNKKVGTISAGTAWQKSTLQTRLQDGSNLIEVRDSEGTGALDVDMMTLTLATDGGSGEAG